MGQPPQMLVIVKVSDEGTALTGRSDDNARTCSCWSCFAVLAFARMVTGRQTLRLLLTIILSTRKSSPFEMNPSRSTSYTLKATVMVISVRLRLKEGERERGRFFCLRFYPQMNTNSHQKTGLRHKQIRCRRCTCPLSWPNASGMDGDGPISTHRLHPRRIRSAFIGQAYLGYQLLNMMVWSCEWPRHPRLINRPTTVQHVEDCDRVKGAIHDFLSSLDDLPGFIQSVLADVGLHFPPLRSSTLLL